MFEHVSGKRHLEIRLEQLLLRLAFSFAGSAAAVDLHVNGLSDGWSLITGRSDDHSHQRNARHAET